MLSQKAFLAAVYILSFPGYHSNDCATDPATEQNLALYLGVNSSELHNVLTEAKANNFVQTDDGVIRLTKAGRGRFKVVLLGGSFDVIHPGHVETLQQAKALGDILVVSVTRDTIFEKTKRRVAFHNEELRRKLVLAIRYVDAAVLGSEADPYGSLSLEPDTVALGYDQQSMEQSIVTEIAKRGLDTKVVMLKSSTPDIKTRKILSENQDVLKEL